MLYKINYRSLLILMLSLATVSCASNSGYGSSSSGPKVFPSKDLLLAGVDLQKNHRFPEVKAQFYNADISNNSLNSTGYLTLFLKEIIAEECRWYLTQWHLNDGLLGFQLDCDSNVREVLLKGTMTGSKYQINDIYSHKFGFWLSELVAAQLEHQADFTHWQAVMNEIRYLETGYGHNKVIASELAKLKHKDYFSGILSFNYTPLPNSKTRRARFTKALNQFEKLSRAHPQYPNSMSMNLAFNSEDYAHALQILNQVESKVGKSKMSLLRRSLFHYKQGDLSQAYHYAIFAHKFGIRSFWPSFYLIRYSVETEQYDEALALLKLQFDSQGDWSDGWIAEFENGSAFLQFKDYKTWRKQA